MAREAVVTKGRVLVGALIAGVLLLPALSDAATTERIRLVAADQQAARASVIVRSDLDAQSGWKGGIVGGLTRSSDKGYTQSRCGSHKPNLSAFVLTGASASAFHARNGDDAVAATVWVLQNAAMAEGHWEQIAAPGYVACELRFIATQYEGMGMVVESIKTLTIPVGSHSYAAQAILGPKGRLKYERIAVDFALVGEGRTVAGLVYSHVYFDNTQLQAALSKERHLSALMLKRAAAHGA